MANINKNPALMALPSSIKRGIAAALDNTSVWYSYDLMSAYAKGGSFATAAGVATTAYVGQILTLVNEIEKTATAYVITNAEGNLQEVGSTTLTDEKTITLKEGALSLKNWGTEYYKWEEDDSDTGGKYVLQIVDEENPWIAGLEPKSIVTSDGTVEIAWYEPSTATIEGVNSAIASVQNTVENLIKGIGSVEDSAGDDTVYGAINKIKEENAAIETAIESKLSTDGGTLTGNLTLKDGSLAVSEKVVETKIAAAIESAGHLKREIVDSLPSITEAKDDTIYMIKKENSNDYLEYILVTVNGVSSLEQIGDTTVDLTSYMKKIEDPITDNFVKLDANGGLVDAGFNANYFVPATHLEGFIAHVSTEERNSWNAKVSSTDENYLMLVENTEKLVALPEIKIIGSGLTLADGVLTGTQEYDLPAASDTVLGGILSDNKTVFVSSEGILSVKVVEENGLSITENGIKLAIATSTSAGAMSAEQAAKLESLSNMGGQDNIIEGALLGPAGEEVAIEDKKLILPVAGSTLGLVKGSEQDNKIKVEADGTMSVNRVSTSNLYIAEGDEFILDGGNA